MAERPVFDKVTDLEAVETVQPTDITRQASRVPNVPVPTQSISPALPTLRVEDVPSEQALVLPPKAEIEVRQSPQLTRRRTVDPNKFVQPSSAATEEPIPQGNAPTPELQTTSVDVARNDTLEPTAPADTTFKQIALDSRVAPHSDTNPLITPATPTASPASPSPNLQLARIRNNVEVAIAPERVTTEKVESENPNANNSSRRLWSKLN